MRDWRGQNSTKSAEWFLHAYRARLGGVVRFVLLHSPAVGPATWRPVAEQLRSVGHQVVVPDLRPVARGPAPHWHLVRERVLAAIADDAAGQRAGAVPDLPRSLALEHLFD